MFGLSTELIRLIGHRKEIRELTFRAFVRSNQGIVSCMRFISRSMELRYWNKLVE